MVRRLFLGTLLGFLTCAQAHALEYHRYHGHEEINSYLSRLQEAHPDIVSTRLIGYSHEGREVLQTILGHPNAAQAILINGTHHGNEKASTEAVLGLLDHLIQNRFSPPISALLAQYALHFVPLVNIDGHARNTRTDATGMDPNRDYAYPGRSSENSFKLQTTRLIKRLTERTTFRAAMAYHAGMEAVLWPACHSQERAQDAELFEALAKATAEAMGIERYLQSYHDYPSEGEFIDYIYESQGTIALTVEVSNDPSPPPALLKTVVDRSIKGALSFLKGVMMLDQSYWLDSPTEDSLSKVPRKGRPPLLAGRELVQPAHH